MANECITQHLLFILLNPSGQIYLLEPIPDHEGLIGFQEKSEHGRIMQKRHGH